MKAILACAFALCCPLAAAASELPGSITPAAPFPRIVGQAPSLESIAPGVTYADYEVQTVDGPLSIHVIAVQPRHPGIRLSATLAHDALTSSGE